MLNDPGALELLGALIPLLVFHLRRNLSISAQGNIHYEFKTGDNDDNEDN